MPACFDAPCRLFPARKVVPGGRRVGDYLFVFNYAETPACVRLDCAYINVLTGERVEKGGELHLGKNDSQVLKREA